MLDGTGETGLVYTVNIPEISAGAQAGAVPLGNGLLDWLGVTGDNSLWGKGVKIAILDTGHTEQGLVLVPRLQGFHQLLDRLMLVALGTVFAG